MNDNQSNGLGDGANGAPEGKKSNLPKILIACAIAAVVIIGAIFAVSALLSNKSGGGLSGKGNALNKALATSVDAYGKEAKLFVDGNDVFSTIGNLKDKFRVFADVEGMLQVELKGEAKKAVSLTVSSEMLPGTTLDIFATMENLIAGSEKIAYLNLPMAGMKDAVTSFMTLNKDFLGMTDDDITYMLDEYGEVFDSLESSFTTSLQDQKEMSDRLEALQSKLIGSFDKMIAQQKVESESSTILIGGEEQKCTMLTVVLDEETIANWLIDDLFPILETEEVLKDICDMTDSQQAAGGLGYVEVGDSYAELLSTIDSMREDLIEAKTDGVEDAANLEVAVYKDVIVSAKITALSDGESVGAMTISALGKDYRLDDVMLSVDDEMSIRIFGSIINTNNFEMNVEVDSYGTVNTAAVIWNVKEQGDNVSVQVDGEEVYAFSLGMDGKEVSMVLPIPSLGNITGGIGSFNGSITVPKDVIQLAEFDLARMEDFISPEGIVELQTLLGTLMMLGLSM